MLMLLCWQQWHWHIQNWLYVCVTCCSLIRQTTSSLAQFPDCPASVLVWRFSCRCCTGACLHFMRWKKKDLILFLYVFRPWATRCFLGYPGWYQISPARLLLYQPRCPPAKQMTAALHTHRHLSLCDKRHVSPSPIHLSSISYYCQGEIATRMALQQEPAVNSGHPGGCLSSILAVRRCYFYNKK